VQLDPNYTGWQVDQDVPAVVHPLVHHYRAMAHVDTPESPAQGPVDWMVVVLDLGTIQKNTLPVLVHRDFGSRRELDYRVAVIAPAKPTEVIYSSDPGFPGQGHEAYDATMNVFGLPSRIVETHVKSVLSSRESFGRDDTSRPSGPGWQWFPVIQYGGGTAPWMLVVQRRSGPIDAAVNRVWRINLFTGMAVLLLLAASVGLIVVATRRAQHLAQIQMNFVTGVSHELRTPLSVVLSAAENIADGVVDKPLDVREHGRIIISQARFLSDLVDRILLFSAGNAGITSEPSRATNVSEVVDRVLENLAGPIRSTGVHVERNIQPLLPCVLADPVVLAQCLQNLVVNAIKYRGQNKWISISAELCNSDHSSPEIQINVQDRGIGIRESELNYIFEPFYRSPDVVARQIQGTGLGLSVVRRSVLEMGGRLRVSSTFASGSTFTICLPVAPQKAHDTAARASKANGVTVL
jgi:signal transduction histidine kinase